MGRHNLLDFDEHYPPAPDGLKRADYFLRDPPVVVEQKDIQAANREHTDRFVESLLLMVARYQPDIVSIDELKPDLWGDDAKQEAVRLEQVAGRQVDRYLSNANEQIRDACRVAGLAHGEGICLIVNQGGGHLPFEIVSKMILLRLDQRRANDELRFKHINGLIYVHHAQGYTIHDGRNWACISTTRGTPIFNRLLTEIVSSWCARQAGNLAITS